MASDVCLECRCGGVRWRARGVSAAVGNRVVCYCRSCQAFAHFLGDAAGVLDAHGGTDIFQMSPARLTFTHGADRLACMRLTPGGLLRWYAACCRTPVGNTAPQRGLAFVGLILRDVEAADERFGPVRDRVWGRDAKGDRSQLDADEKGSLRLILRFVWMLLTARLRGDHLRSPFLDPATGSLRVEPQVLTPDELSAVEAQRDAG